MFERQRVSLPILSFFYLFDDLVVDFPYFNASIKVRNSKLLHTRMATLYTFISIYKHCTIDIESAGTCVISLKQAI